jgi:hypothetical protein
MGEHRRDPNGHPPEEHSWAHDLLGPYLLGALNPEEKQAVERHLAGCTTCREEEHGLRETHQQLVGAAVAVSSAPPDLKGRVFAGLPPREGSEATSAGAARGASRLASRAGRVVAAATATLAPTELAPGAGGELTVQSSGPNAEASLEVWGLPQTGPDEYYELWFGKEGGRVSAGTFTVDRKGRRRLSANVPTLDGDYQRVGITLERFPEEPRMSSAEVVLRGDLRET